MEIVILRVVNLNTKSKHKCGCWLYKRHELGDEASLESIVHLGSILGSVSAQLVEIHSKHGISDVQK